MIIPALYFTYIISSAVPIKKRMSQLAIATVVLLLISLSWAIIVDLVPKEDRPYVGSSTNNTVMELIIGHNGLERLGIGNSGFPSGANRIRISDRQGQPPINDRDSNFAPIPQIPNQYGQDMFGKQFDGYNPPQNNFGLDGQNNMMPPANKGRNIQQRAGGMGGTFGGQEKASITRLFSNNSLSDQIIWLFPIAIFGFISASINTKLKGLLIIKKNYH